MCVGNGQINQSHLQEKAGALNCMHDQQIVLTETTVRRLTPTECERLQGLPDDYTAGGSDTARTGTKGGTSGTSSGGDETPTAPPAPPAERVEASLRAEATPEYPQELIEDDVEGSVTVKILVAADGSVESVKLVTSSGYSAMDRAAIAAGYRFQFNPGDNGRRGVWTKTFRFQLE